MVRSICWKQGEVVKRFGEIAERKKDIRVRTSFFFRQRGTK